MFHIVRETIFLVVALALGRQPSGSPPYAMAIEVAILPYELEHATNKVQERPWSFKCTAFTRSELEILNHKDKCFLLCC